MFEQQGEREFIKLAPYPLPNPKQPGSCPTRPWFSALQSSRILIPIFAASAATSSTDNIVGPYLS